jgi:Restriction Endonuclease associating with ARP
MLTNIGLPQFAVIVVVLVIFCHLHAAPPILNWIIGRPHDEREHMTETKPLHIIKARQRAWALRNGRALDKDGYCAGADDNLFRRLSETARDDFDRGGGGELGKPGERGKIQATHSSSALACNWFDYWRERDFGVLSTAFGVSNPFVTLRLEAHVPTGMRGADANLDVLLTTADGSLFGIESKFTEPYTPSTAKNVLKPQYFAQNRSRWTDVAARLPSCRRATSSRTTRLHGSRRSATVEAHACAGTNGQSMDALLPLVRGGGVGGGCTSSRLADVRGSDRHRRRAFHGTDVSGAFRPYRDGCRHRARRLHGVPA